MIAVVEAPSISISGVIKLPSSKSISNRVLLIKSLCSSDFTINNLSDSDDTTLLVQALNSSGEIMNAGLGGTTARFLIAYAALKGNGIKITGEEALLERPVKPLVDALISLGAEVEYAVQEGRLPLIFKKALTKGGYIKIDASVSSQFISALMMIAPLLIGGLTIELIGEPVSMPYISMTAGVMKHFGVAVEMKNNLITVPESNYIATDYTVESDWTAASYWYELTALSTRASLTLDELNKSDMQGDLAISGFMKQFGVITSFENRKVLIEKQITASAHDNLIQDLTGTPDIGPSLIVAAAGLGVTADFPGLKNFRIKESDRAAALQRELYKFRIRTDFCGGSKFKVYPSASLTAPSDVLSTYNDHRIAMALAPMALKTGQVRIADPHVVKKSYPQFWNDLQKVGFTITFEEDL